MARTIEQIDAEIARLKEERKQAQAREREADAKGEEIAKTKIGDLVLSFYPKGWRSVDPSMRAHGKANQKEKQEMKKLLAVILALMLSSCLAGCTGRHAESDESTAGEEICAEDVDEAVSGERFEYVDGNMISAVGQAKIYVDNETGVQYLWVGNGYQGGLTVLVDADGKPLVKKEG